MIYFLQFTKMYWLLLVKTVRWYILEGETVLKQSLQKSYFTCSLLIEHLYINALVIVIFMHYLVSLWLLMWVSCLLSDLLLIFLHFQHLLCGMYIHYVLIVLIHCIYIYWKNVFCDTLQRNPVVWTIIMYNIMALTSLKWTEEKINLYMYFILVFFKSN